MRRFLALAVGALALGGAAPAGAHEEINPASVPTGKPVFLAVNAANERKVDLTKLTVTAPQGSELGTATKDPPGWTANRTSTAVTWSGGSVKPDHFEQWGFEIEGADQPGTVSYKVTLGFADGSSEDADVPVTVHVGSETSPSGDSAGAPASRDDGTAGDGNDGDGDGEGRATAALVLAAVALLAALVAAGLAVRRRAATPAPSPTGGGQDW